jgi:hypothetical protein
VVPGEEVRPEATATSIVMAGVGGILAFFGMFFALIGAIAESGFLTAGLAACGIALVLFVLAYISRRRQLADWRKRRDESMIAAICCYCGFQNARGIRKCESCGAPLRWSVRN